MAAPGVPNAAGFAGGEPRAVRLASAVDLEGFRRACRTLWAEQVDPGRVSWHSADESESDLFDNGERGAPAVASQAPPVQVPAAFMALCQSVILHLDDGRFGLLYRLLWRLQLEPGLRHDPLDPDWVQAQAMAQDVRHAMHDMKAGVRFRAVHGRAGEGTVHVAWFDPGHHVVEALAPFFAGRFAKQRWAILTPQRCVRGVGDRFSFGPPLRRDLAPPPDAGDAIWLDSCASVFDQPWPEAADHGAREGLAADEPAPRSLPDLGRALERCRDCAIGEHAARAVPGEGPLRAPLMFVGEQPGDQEDQQGRPFVGPAGQLLDRALVELGIARSEVFITNAVKHFKFELRGRRRIHKTPAQEEAAACLHWLETEIALVDPGAIVALGATAARQLMGASVAVTRQRGQWLVRGDGRRVLITLHPSALLRMETHEQEAGRLAWLADLRLAAEAFATLSTRRPG
jgi:probable DNA metabolism protein